MTAGHKIGRRGKGVPKQVELDTSADTQTTTQVVKHHADDLGNNQSTTRKPGGFMQSCVFPCIVKFLVHLLQYLKDTINIIPQTTTKYVILYENWVTQI